MERNASERTGLSVSCVHVDDGSVQRLGYINLLINPLFQTVNMGDNPDEPFSVGQIGKNLQRVAQCIVIQGAEPLVDKHGFHADCAALGLHNIGKTQGQGKTGQEGFSAGKGVHITPLARAPVQNIQIQTALTHTVTGFFLAAQGEKPIRQYGQPFVGGGDHLLEIILLYVGFKGELSAECAAGDPGTAVVQFPDNGPVFFTALLQFTRSQNFLKCVFVRALFPGKSSLCFLSCGFFIFCSFSCWVRPLRSGFSLPSSFSWRTVI